MEKLIVSSLPLHSVISDIAREFGVDYNKKCGIYSVDVPAKLGKGVIKATDFNDGLGMIRYDCTFDGGMVIKYSVDKVHPVKFLFCMEGALRHNFMDEEIWHDIPKFRNAIVASSSHHGHQVHFAAGQRTVYNSLELDRRGFQGKISCEPLSIGRSWRNMLNDVTAKNTFYHDGHYSLKLAQLFNVWEEHAQRDWLLKLSLEGVAYEVLVHQINQFKDDKKAKGKKSVLRSSELDQLLRAVKIMEERMEDLPTITDLGSEVGLNANKLQQGFREVFGMSVNTYVNKKRMEKARILISRTDHKLSVIAGMVGYRSPSYMTKTFTQFYGISPSEFRKEGTHRRTLPAELMKLQGI